MTDMLVTSLAVEVIRDTRTRMYVTSAAVELLRKTFQPPIRSTGMAVEVIRSGVQIPRSQVIVATGD